MDYHFAADLDLDLLAEWNHQLIRDEGHRNPMSILELRERMQRWLQNEYNGLIFCCQDQAVAYALYTETAEEVHLRQLFVRRDCRRQGIGRTAVTFLHNQLWEQNKRRTVDVLTANAAAIAFWRSVGYQDYCLTLEILPEKQGG